MRDARPGQADVAGHVGVPASDETLVVHSLARTATQHNVDKAAKYAYRVKFLHCKCCASSCTRKTLKAWLKSHIGDCIKSYWLLQKLDNSIIEIFLRFIINLYENAPLR